MVLFWALPPVAVNARAWLLICVTIGWVYLLSPKSVALALAVCAITLAAGWLMTRGPRRAVFWSAVAVIVGLLWWAEPPADGPQEAVATLGLSYVVLKSISVLSDIAIAPERAKDLRLTQLLLLNFFFPTFTAGPIERYATFARRALAARFDPEMAVYGVTRIAVGLFKISFLCAEVLNTLLEGYYSDFFTAEASFGPLASLGLIWLRFLYLYLNFSGYSDVAVGTGRLFGLEIMENFRYPLLARNLQEFWQRWHLSLGQFVFGHLFMGLARLTNGRIGISLFLAFVTIGLWHRLSVNYFIWGICHGLGLVAVMHYSKLARSHPRFARWRASWPHAVASWLLTVSFVAWMSVFANASSLEDGLLLTRRLIGIER